MAPRSLPPAQLLPPHTAVRIEDVHLTYRARAEVNRQGRGSLFGKQSRSWRTIEALRGVDFEVPYGSVYGVIGHNGAGKSTLFKAISGILAPTHGRITVAGRVTPLLALGIGFNRELTGRENVLLGGLAIGLHPDEIMERFDEVVAFADLGEALNYPMRTYSSGMFARLGFAVAAHLDPEILLIDEALSAGDSLFRNKCMDKLVELCGKECTVMIISHGLELIELLADRCVWLELGKVVQEGPANKVVESYLASDDLTVQSTAAMNDI